MLRLTRLFFPHVFPRLGEALVSAAIIVVSLAMTIADTTASERVTFATGAVYEGDFVDGKQTGKGRYTFANGAVYEGDFVDDKRTGKGRITFANGDVYEGDFVDGRIGS